VVCAALPAAAQTLTVDHNPAYVGENLTFIYTPGDCMDSEAITFTRDATFYTGDEKSFDIQLQLNTDGPYAGLYTGTHTTTADDVGNDVIAIDDDCNESVEPVYLAVERFDGFYVYHAVWVDSADVAALKSNPANTVGVDAMLTPDNDNFDATILDWSLSSSGINWRLDNWGGDVYTGSPGYYEFFVSLDGFATYHYVDAWVISAVLKSLTFTSGTEIYNNNSDWTDTGTLNSPPDWTPSMSGPNPLQQKMGTTVRMSATVNVEPQGLPYQLTASSTPGYLDFGASDWTEANGSDQTFDMTASTLPNNVCATSDSISWSIDAFDAQILFNCLMETTGPHKFYVTYDAPINNPISVLRNVNGQQVVETINNIVTEKRLNYACDNANNGNAPHDLVNTFGNLFMTGGQPMWNPANSIGLGIGGLYDTPWELLGYGNLSGGDCVTEAALAQFALDMIGVSGSSWTRVYPCSKDWTALKNNGPETDPTYGHLGYYMSTQSTWNDYEGCLFYKDNQLFEYWPGGYSSPQSFPSAVGVLHNLLDPNTNPTNGHAHPAYDGQSWNWATAVPFPDPNQYPPPAN
jgi:hypothetical protein